MFALFSRYRTHAIMLVFSLFFCLSARAEIINYTFDDNIYLSGSYTFDDVQDYVTSFDIDVLINNDPVTTRVNNIFNITRLHDIEAGNFWADIHPGGDIWTVYIDRGRPFPPTVVLASVSAVPEPATYLMMMAGLILLLTLKAKRQKL